MGDRKRVSRKRAEGTREHIVAYLIQAGELADSAGMASTRLATAVGYPGSSVAFAQLLSGMERSGIIERDVRGKRTYRIGLSRARIAAPGGRGSGAAANGQAGALAIRGSRLARRRLARRLAASARPRPGAAPGPAGFDYDELARRLLAQVIRRLAEPGLGQPRAGRGEHQAAGAAAGRGGVADTGPGQPAAAV